MKQCIICGEYKQITCFHKNKSGELGVDPRCKECRKKQYDNRPDIGGLPIIPYKDIESVMEHMFEELIIPEDPDACWDARLKMGYGYNVMLINGFIYHMQKITQWLLEGEGPIGDKKHLRHTHKIGKWKECTCPNPRHSEYGTFEDNMNDMNINTCGKNHEGKKSLYWLTVGNDGYYRKHCYTCKYEYSNEIIEEKLKSDRFRSSRWPTHEAIEYIYKHCKTHKNYPKFLEKYKEVIKDL